MTIHRLEYSLFIKQTNLEVYIKNLANHPYFEVWKDPVSGVESYILNKRVAPIQQSFYFTNPSLSQNEDLLWFYAAYPPSPGKTLGVVSLDPDNPFIHHFPTTEFTSVSPMVAPEGDAVYFSSGGDIGFGTQGTSIWRMKIGEEPKRICTLDVKFINRRTVTRLATHLTMSADKRYFLVDGAFTGQWFIGIADIETGEIKILREFKNHYNHAQFSPIDPNLFLLAQDWWFDQTSGQVFELDHRLWLMDINNTMFEPLRPMDYYGHGTESTHEWWSNDGLICWIDYKKGAFECDVKTRKTTNVWKEPLCHGHCNKDRTLWVADQSPYFWRENPPRPCDVKFFNRNNDKLTNIVTAMPKPNQPRDAYHIDPHPQFSPQNNWIVYTTTVRGQVDVALTPVKQLV